MVDIRAEAAEAEKIRGLYDTYDLYKALRRIVDACDEDEDVGDVATHGSFLRAVEEARRLLERSAP